MANKEHYLDTFWLIQRGKVIRDKKTNQAIELECMGAAEFEFGAVDYSYIRIFNNYRNYEVYLTGITNPEGRELVLFCNKEEKDRILEAIKRFIEHPYMLKEFSRLEKVPTGENENTEFWWCIDKYDDIGDWMLFFEDDIDTIKDSIREEYYKKWVPLTARRKKKLLEIAMRGYK